MRIRRLIVLMMAFLAAGPAVSGTRVGQEASAAPLPETRAESWARHFRMAGESPFRGLRWQSLGPRYQGGRVETIDAVPGTGTIYVGFGAGSIWKTINNGLTWEPVFEHEATFSIGDLAVSRSNPDIIYVGTGENLLARSSFAGAGVFKSSDGGKAWTALGLEDTHHIGRVVIHPENPEIVYVAALGHEYTFNEERGVFKTEDGGRTWRKVLYVADNVGAVDVALDPSDPDTVYASLNEHDRKAWNNVEHGANSGLYKSTDAGRTWKRLAGGFPAGEWVGRIGIGIAPSAPNVVYAFLSNQTPVEVKTSEGKRTSTVGPEIYRSDDRGESWRKLPMKSDRFRMGFYGDIVVAPDDPNTFYALGQNLMRSTDGGLTFVNVHGRIIHLYSHPSPALHLDHHDLWMDPANPDRMILGNDGGVYLTPDRGRNWLHLNNIPAGEFYSVSLDDADPYFIYGGTQDNAAQFGPADRALQEGIEDPWHYVWIDLWGGGDSFVTRRDPTNRNVIYFEQQFGNFQRKDMKTGEIKRIRPRAGKGEPELRYNWMSPFIISSHNPLTVYFGANKLCKSLNKGDDWQIISPDLSGNPGPERQGNVPYGTITTISESPLRPGLLYSGTDDGRVWVTRNDGVTWQEIGRQLPAKWVSCVTASPHAIETVYVTLTGYREDDFSTYAFKSVDCGTTWVSIAAGLPSEQANVIREDPLKPGILYLGTDQGGVYASLDGGKSWESLCADLPTAAVQDIAVQAREREMVIATHGRSVFKLDIAPVQDFSPDVLDKPAHLFPVRPARLPQSRDYGGDWALETMTPAVIHYHLQSPRSVTVRIFDKEEKVVWEARDDGGAGINTVEWDLFVVPPASEPGVYVQAPRPAKPGTYRVEIQAGTVRLGGPVEINAPAQPKVGYDRTCQAFNR